MPWAGPAVLGWLLLEGDATEFLSAGRETAEADFLGVVDLVGGTLLGGASVGSTLIAGTLVGSPAALPAFFFPLGDPGPVAGPRASCL